MGALIQAAKEFLQWLFHWWTGPRLEVSFDPSGEPREAIVADADNRTGCFYRLLVTNRGHRTAEECQAFLVAVEPCVAGRSLERPGVLKWAHEATYDAVAIEPEEERKLDLFFVLDRDPRIHFFIEMPPVPAGFSRVFEPVPYRVKVRAKAKGGASGTASFVVEPSGDPRAFRISKSDARA